MPDCHRPLPPVPSDVSSWWTAIGCASLETHPKTLEMPQDVYSWWSSGGGSVTYEAVLTKEFGVQTVIPAGPTVTLVTSSNTLPVSGDSTKLPPNPPTPSPTTPATEPPPSITSSTRNAQTSPPNTSDLTTTSLGIANLSPSSTLTGNIPGASTNTMSGNGSESESSTGTRTPTLSSNLPETTTASSPTLGAAKSNNKTKTLPIVVGVVVPLVFIILGVTAFILYKRRQRARDRREWERTHEAIADAVRQVGAPPAPGLPVWNPARGDVKELLDGDTAPLFDKSA